MRRTSATILLTSLLVAVPASAFANGAADYKAKCQMCHAADGSGDTPAGKKLGARDLRSPEVAKLTDAQLITITTEGKNKMPAYKGKLTHEQITALVAYIRDLQQKK